MRILLLLLVLLPLLSYSQKGPIKVTLNSGETIQTNYLFLNNNSGFRAPFIRIDGPKGERISIDRINFVDGPDQAGKYRYYKPVYFQGSKIFAERTFTSERISIFYTQIISGTWQASYSFSHYNYSKDNYPLQKASYTNLSHDLSDNMESMNYLKKANQVRFAQFLLYGVGSALVVHGISSGLNRMKSGDPNNSGINIPPTLIAGAITLYIPYFLNSPKQDNLVKALEVYK